MNRGASETARELERRQLSVNAAAKLVESDSGTFSKILRAVDGRKPGRALAFRIFAKLGISPALWDEEIPDPEQPAQLDKPTGTES